MSSELRGFSSYTLLIDSRVAFELDFERRNQDVTDGLRYVIQGLQYGKLKEFAYNRETKESYAELWNAEHIKRVQIAWTMELGEKYRHYHIHAHLIIEHEGLENFGLNYSTFRVWVREVLRDYLFEDYPGGRQDVPKPFIDFKLNRTDSVALLELYLEKPLNNVEIESSRGLQDGTITSAF